MANEWLDKDKTIYGTPGKFSPEFLKSLPRGYESPKGPTINMEKIWKKVKKLPEKKKDELLASMMISNYS